MKHEENNKESALALKATLSSVGSVSSGIARMNSEHLTAFGDEIPELIVVESEKHKKVVKLVSDKFAKRGRIVLRKDDLDDLKIEEGDQVEIMPYSKLTDDLKSKWNEFKEKFKKEEGDEEEEKEEDK